MNAQILSVLELLKNGDIRSALEQLALLQSSLSTQQTQLNNIVNTLLPAKVDKIGVINGGGVYENLLEGDFQFGDNVAGHEFRGVIETGSRIRHYGDTIDNADITNVGFVKNQLDPIRKLAQLAIRRNGDVVKGASGGRIDYTFDYINWNFGKNTTFTFGETGVTVAIANFVNSIVNYDATSQVFYRGAISDPYHNVNKVYVDTAIAIATSQFLIRNTNSYTNNTQDIFVNFVTEDSNGRIAKINVADFTFDSDGIVYNGIDPLHVNIRFLLNGKDLPYHFTTSFNITGYVYKNASEIDSSAWGYGTDNTNSRNWFTVYVDVDVQLNQGDKIKFRINQAWGGAGPFGGYGTTDWTIRISGL